MNGNEITDEIKTMVQTGELPAKVTQRMLLAMLLDISGKLEKSLTGNEEEHKCFRETTKNQKDYPSVTWLFAHKTVKTIGMFLLIFSVLMALYTAGILKIFGLAVGVNLP